MAAIERARCVYAIYAHTAPNQVLRLVRAIRSLSPKAHVVVHYDPGHETLDPRPLIEAGASLVPSPVQGEWGDFSQVLQHLHTMRWCLHNLDFDWYITLTGQSYPTKPLLDFESFLQGAPVDGFLYHFDAYDKQIWPGDEARRRYHYRYFRLPRFPYWHRVPVSLRVRIPSAIRKFNSLQPFFRIFAFPRGLSTRIGVLTVNRPFGSTFMPLEGANTHTNFRRVVVQRIVDYVDIHPEYVEYFSRTALPDEAFFSTIACNLSDLRFGNDNLRHIYWPSANAASGGVMDLTHRTELERSDAYFALKFDEIRSSEILKHLDRQLGIDHTSGEP